MSLKFLKQAGIDVLRMPSNEEPPEDRPLSV